MLAGDDDSGSSEAEVDHNLSAAETGAFLPEAAIDPASHPDLWQDIDNLQTAQCSEQTLLSSDPMRPQASSSPRASSELLCDHTMSRLAHYRN